MHGPTVFLFVTMVLLTISLWYPFRLFSVVVKMREMWQQQQHVNVSKSDSSILYLKTKLAESRAISVPSTLLHSLQMAEGLLCCVVCARGVTQCTVLCVFTSFHSFLFVVQLCKWRRGRLRTYSSLWRQLLQIYHSCLIKTREASARLKKYRKSGRANYKMHE